MEELFNQFTRKLTPAVTNYDTGSSMAQNKVVQEKIDHICSFILNYSSSFGITRKDINAHNHPAVSAWSLEWAHQIDADFEAKFITPGSKAENGWYVNLTFKLSEGQASVIELVRSESFQGESVIAPSFQEDEC